MALVTRSVFAPLLEKGVLRGVALDEMKNSEGKLVLKDYLNIESSTQAFEKFEEYAGPGLAMLKAEGAKYPTAGIRRGVSTTIWNKDYGLRMGVTKIAMDDNKYSEALPMSRMLVRSIFKCAEYEGADTLVNGFSSDFTGGRSSGVALWSASQLQPDGSTASNLAATPLTPSVAAVISARTQAIKYPARDGLVGDGFMLKKIICPVDQKPVWDAILGSKLDPTNVGNAALVNITNSYNIEVKEVVYWTNTTTNYAFKTDAFERTGNGSMFLWREKPSEKTWTENSDDNMWQRIFARFGIGWNDWRDWLGVNL